MLEKLVTVTAASLAAGIWQLAAEGNMYPAWALLPREVPSAGQIRHETYGAQTNSQDHR